MAEDRNKASNGGAAWRSTKVRQDTTCELCPCPQLTAYWTNPPACPRRFCCDGKSSCASVCCFRDSPKNTSLFFCVVIVSYFVIMDFILYCYYMKSNLAIDSKGGGDEEIYTPFTHLSVKAILNDQPSQYLIAPSTEWLEHFTNFSKTFYFITPNVVSFTHLIVGFISGKFIASDYLSDRRIGVVMFEFRTWLDAFDGTIFRAQPGNHLKYNSVHNTLGYLVDSTFDTLGGAFLCFGMLFYLLKRFGQGRAQCSDLIPFWNSSLSSGTSSTSNGIVDLQSKKVLLAVNKNSSESNGVGGGSGAGVSGKDPHYSTGLLFFKVLTFGICLGVSGAAWDNIVVKFSEVFQTEIKDPALSALQLQLSHSNTTVFIFQLWRLIGSQCMLNYILVIIFFDKIWEFLSGYQYVFLLMVSSLYVSSLLYINQMREQLHL